MSKSILWKNSPSLEYVLKEYLKTYGNTYDMLEFKTLFTVYLNFEEICV